MKNIAKEMGGERERDKSRSINRMARVLGERGKPRKAYERKRGLTRSRRKKEKNRVKTKRAKKE
jgi:hypothetical protein